MGGFNPMVQFVKPQEAVTAGVTNRAPSALNNNINYLKELLDSSRIGSTLYAYGVTVEPEAAVGMPVYFNTTTERFERALAQMETSAEGGVIMTAASAQVWGVVASKANTTLADVLLFGFAPLDISAAVDGDVAAGTYYLSGTNPGKLTQQRPPISIPVLQTDGLGNVRILQIFIDFLDRHVHHRFPLYCAPAGTHIPPVPGERHVITDADAALPGWLPAEHSSFNGKAPEGAVFGYNLSAHSALANVWPPLPVSQGYLEWDRGVNPEQGFQGVPLGPSGLCVLDRYGIWWMSSCYNQVPWPRSLDTTLVVSESTSASQDECPRELAMGMTLWFTKVNFATDALLVNSLRSADSRVIVRCINGETGSIGDLEILLDLNLVVSNNQRGYLAIKELEGNTFKRGPVCEGVYALSNNVTLTGDATSLVDPTNTDGRRMYHGAVGIEVAPAPTRELEVALVRLNGVEQMNFRDTLYLGFRTGIDSDIRCKLNIPSDVELPNPHLKFRFWLLGRSLGTLPTLTVTGRRVPRPADGLATPLDLPDSSEEFSITIDTTATLENNNQYVEAESESFAVAAGDELYYTVSRSSSDGYAAEVGLLKQVGVLQSGA